MAILGTFTQQPNERLDYDITFDEFLAAGDTLVSASTTSDVGITVDLPIIDGTGRVVKQWISGGTTGTTYKIQIRATSSSGVIKEIEFKIKVREY